MIKKEKKFKALQSDIFENFRKMTAYMINQILNTW